MLSIVQNLIEDNALIKIIDEKGNTVIYAFGTWRNSIGDMEITEGYKFKMSKDAILEIKGDLVQTPLSIPVQKHWNIISYACQNEQDSIMLFQDMLTIFYDVNTGDARTGYISISIPDSQITQTIEIHQAGTGCGHFQPVWNPGCSPNINSNDRSISC